MCGLFLHHFIQKLGWFCCSPSTFCMGRICFCYNCSIHCLFDKSTVLIRFPWQVIRAKCVDCSSIALFESYSWYLHSYNFLPSQLAFSSAPDKNYSVLGQNVLPKPNLSSYSYSPCMGFYSRQFIFTNFTKTVWFMKIENLIRKLQCLW